MTISDHSFDVESLALLIAVRNKRGILHKLSGVISRAGGDINSVAILDNRQEVEHVFFEVSGLDDPDGMLKVLRDLPDVIDVNERKSLKSVFGKRVIIVGGGAQVGQVAVGAVSEADRHNLRGERISVDTIPLVGEQELAEAVRGVASLPRARAVVLAGALMGGEIEDAVREIQQQGLVVISLKMAGSVSQAADLIVTDPIQAGVMAVMAIADTARLQIAKLSQKEF